MEAEFLAEKELDFLRRFEEVPVTLVGRDDVGVLVGHSGELLVGHEDVDSVGVLLGAGIEDEKVEVLSSVSKRELFTNGERCGIHVARNLS